MGEKSQRLSRAMGAVLTGENFQTYILGTKRNGRPRAVYDIVKDQLDGKREKKKKKEKADKFALYYLSPVKKKGKKKNKKKSKNASKYWNF